jgi:hypothetical protein
MRHETREDLKALRASIEDIKLMLLEDIEERASKGALKETNGRIDRVEDDVKKVKERVLYFSGVAAVLSVIAGWFGKQWLSGGGGNP